MKSNSYMYELLTHLFDVWNENEIRHLVLRNYEDLPEFTENDIDVLIDPVQRFAAETLLAQAASENGWQLHNVGEFACRALWLFNQETREQVHIDLMCGVKWHALHFADHQQMLERRKPCKNFFIPSPADEAAVSLMTRLISRGYVKEKYRDRVQQSAVSSQQEMTETLAPWLGGELAEEIVESASQGEWGAVEAQVSKVRKKVLIANLRTPARLSFSLWNDASRFVRRLLWSPGVSIVFFGPDGCGKTSVADGLKEALDKTFAGDKGLHCHWKPVRPKGEGFPPTVDPHSQPARNRLLSLAYFAWHYLPFIWSWWLHVKPVLFKSGLVIIDRYYYDFFVDLRRYRLTLPKWVVRLGFVFVKKPDLVFCLDADPEILQARKKEVSFEECKRQREAYRALAEKLPDGHVVDASQPLEDVVRDVQTVVLQYLAERTTKRMKRIGHEKHKKAQKDFHNR